MLYEYFLCVSIPLVVMLILLNQQSRILILFMIIGALQFLFSQTVAEVLLPAFPATDKEYVMTTYIPLVFELSKAFPIIFYLFVTRAEIKTMLQLSISVGTGFAIMESLHMLPLSSETDLFSVCCLIVIYVLINIICTGLVGLGIAYMAKSIKYILYSALGVFSTAALLHGLINLFIEAHKYLVGAVICILIYLPIVIIYFGQEKQKRIQLRL